MAVREILLRFGVQSLDQALTRAKEIRTTIRDAAKKIPDADLRKQVRQDADRNFRDSKKAIQEEQKLSARLRERGARAREEILGGRRGAGIGGIVDTRAQQLGALREKVPTFLRSATSAASLGAGISALGEGLPGFIPGLGPVAALTGAVVGIVVPIVESKIKVILDAEQTRFRVEVEETLREADVGARFRDDPEFREQTARRLFEEEQRRLARGGWARDDSSMGYW